MNITLLTYGSRGDVQPFVALALGLQKAGHTPTVAAPHRFADFVTQYGLRFAPLAGDPDVLSRMFNDAGTSVYRMLRGMQQYLFKIAPQVMRDTRQALQGADLVVHGFAFTTGGHSLARARGIPDVSVQAFPAFAPTRAFPNVALPAARAGWANYFGHWFFTQVFWHGGNLGFYQMQRQAPAAYPEKLYWPFARTAARPLTPLLFAYSPAVLPKPADWVAPNIHVSGYLFLDHPNYQPPEALAHFLATGAAPVCITFGSMVNRAAERIMQAVLTALERTRQRAIFLTGWGSQPPAEPPAHVLFWEAVPHDWLFPRCKIIVHHGGAGTTAAGLRSGRPNIVVPHAADQPFWGNRVAALGAGPRPIPVKALTAENLTAALTAAATMEKSAAALGRAIRAETGIDTAVRLIEQHAAEFKK